MSAAHASARSAAGHRPGTGLVARLRLALIARSQRKALARFDPRMLDDIGVTRDEAQAEARRPLWDVPPSWLR